MNLLIATALLYLACVGFYHASPKRSALAPVSKHSRFGALLRCLAWFMASLALVVLSTAIGLERAVPIWLALFSAVGFASLWLASRNAGWHVKSTLPATMLLVLGLAGLVFLA